MGKTQIIRVFPLLVPGAGVEPAQVLPRWILNPVRLPIPPSGQFGSAKLHFIFKYQV